MTRSINDKYTASQSDDGSTAVTIAAIPVSDVLSIEPVRILKQLTRFPGSSPPISETKYLLDEVFLI